MKNKIYKEKETGKLYTPVTRYLKIKTANCTKRSRFAYFCDWYDNEKYGCYFYFMYKKMKIALGETERLYCPIFVNDENGKLIVISGYYTISNALALLVEVAESGEYVRIWKEVEP